MTIPLKRFAIFAAAILLPAGLHAATLLPTETLRVNTRTDLAAIDVSGGDAVLDNGDIVILEEAARRGAFQYTTNNISALVTDDPQQCLVVARGDDTDGSSGGYVRVRESPEVNIEFCGAIANDNTADTTAVQAAIDVAEEFGSSLGGTVSVPSGTFDTDNDLVIDKPGVCIKGVSSDENGRGSILKGDHTDGPVLRIKSHHWCLQDFLVNVSDDRRNATRIGSNYAGLSKAFDDQNYGIWVEGADSAGQLVGYAYAKNVWVHNQPNSSWVFSGRTYETMIEGGGSRNAIGHGFVITDGTYTGRANKDAAAGIMELSSFESYGNKDHALVVGYPTAARGAVVRMLVDNFDSYGNATSSGSTSLLLPGATQYEVYFVADNSRFVYGAINGEQGAATNVDHGGMFVGGRQVVIENTRLLGMDPKDSAVFVEGTHNAEPAVTTSGIEVRWPTVETGEEGVDMLCLVNASSGGGQVYVFDPTEDGTYDEPSCGAGIANAQDNDKSIFRATRSVNQAGVVDSVLTKVNFNTEALDVGGHYDFTNAKWTPTAGVVTVSAAVHLSGTFTDGALLQLSIYKNNSALRSVFQRVSGTTSGFIETTLLDFADGNDYYEAFAMGDVASGTVTFGSVGSIFTGIHE
jgi:hypothetical protein